MEIQFKYKNDSEYWTYYSQFCRTTFLKPAEVYVFKLKTREEFILFQSQV